MNLIQLYNNIKHIAKQIKLVQSVSDGDVYAAYNNNERKYAAVNVDCENIQRNEQGVTYSLILYYADRLQQNDENFNAIVTDGVNCLQTIINAITSDDNSQVVYYLNPIVYTPYRQKFADYLGGVYARVQLVTEFELGGCEMENVTTVEEDIIQILKNAVEKYQQENAEVAELLNEILYKLLRR